MSTITLNHKEYTVRYPLNAIRALERETGKSVFQIFNTIAGGEGVSFDLMICIIWAGLLFSNRLVNPETVGTWLNDVNNLPEIFNTCAAVFTDSVQSHIPGSENDKETENETETAAETEKN